MGHTKKRSLSNLTIESLVLTGDEVLGIVCTAFGAINWNQIKTTTYLNAFNSEVFTLFASYDKTI